MEDVNQYSFGLLIQRLESIPDGVKSPERALVSISTTILDMPDSI